jgi:hypothetical protein
MQGILVYLAAVAIASVFIWYDMRFFALYAFMVILGLILYGFDRLWKLVRVSHASNAGKIMVVAKRVGVSDADYKNVKAELRAADPQAWATVERDFKNL